MKFGTGGLRGAGPGADRRRRERPACCRPRRRGVRRGGRSWATIGPGPVHGFAGIIRSTGFVRPVCVRVRKEQFMRVVIAGGHGRIALLLARVLAGRGDEVLSLIRKPEQAGDVEAAGATPVVLDLETASRADTARALAGADAAVFAAGAGPGSTAERKYTVDKGGSVLLADACEEAGVDRFVQVSSMGAGEPVSSGGDPVWAAYIDAKTQAEEDLKSRGLEWTIVRPGGLTDDAAAGTVTLAPPPVPRAQVPRADVAAVIAELLGAPGMGGLTLELRSGPTPIPEAVAALKPTSG
jgi:uncharacterized protein YbjT (DUF2867 family)